MEEKMRINKYLASCGVASRRKCEEIISRGKVTVNGEVVRELGTIINVEKDLVKVYGKEVSLDTKKVYYMLNKPQGVISASKSKYGEETVVDLLGKKEHRLFPVGRLDKDTTGLIILTNDGDFAYKLTHPKYEKEKTYEALVKGKVDSKSLDKLKQGVVIDGKKTSRAKVRLVKMIGVNSLVEITLIEGRKRQVKKMCEKVGHKVIKLNRTMENGLSLGDLEIGEYRKLTKNEVSKLLK
ncbi:rRNA pseudouridine synthase [Anaerofustis stercorihominis]|uniref:Pseudouridine synthase n=1 Tax=Anaerofustis stercorihominis DSM 17244 TaxID=445971 RepID=B1C6T1_9FIRM|nr:pseudouridine synthase [Anaerofustis stercorihominis]EDS72718.1 pseudouridylate synthase [Anaerofustis stercorihominis DSM 17244]MCQ4794092.1 rRNA pseudouridine synthase [Anaerofustis stercorihominis]